MRFDNLFLPFILLFYSLLAMGEIPRPQIVLVDNSVNPPKIIKSVDNPEDANKLLAKYPKFKGVVEAIKGRTAANLSFQNDIIGFDHKLRKQGERISEALIYVNLGRAGDSSESKIINDKSLSPQEKERLLGKLITELHVVFGDLKTGEGLQKIVMKSGGNADVEQLVRFAYMSKFSKKKSKTLTENNASKLELLTQRLAKTYLAGSLVALTPLRVLVGCGPGQEGSSEIIPPPKDGEPTEPPAPLEYSQVLGADGGTFCACNPRTLTATPGDDTKPYDEYIFKYVGPIQSLEDMAIDKIKDLGYAIEPERSRTVNLMPGIYQFYVLIRRGTDDSPTFGPVKVLLTQ
ncbi:MAG: hypothetical protein A4S09_01845 [Proteobacteria bacterium SG_bin7]|nr:MAG: hypothetical protein A4S09_01845 [Proteobacteria bacterium SG_bin7]